MANIHESEQRHQKPAGISLASNIFTTDFITLNGRPLREMRAGKAVIDQQRARGVVFNLRHHKHNDSRAEYPDLLTNMPAFEAITGHEQEVFDGFAWINYQYFNGDSPSQITARELNDMAIIGNRLPLYLVHRASNPLKRDALPDVVGNIMKTSAGINLTSRVILNQYGEEAVVSPEFVYDVSNTNVDEETSPPLVGAEVCPAPRFTILNTVNPLIHRIGGDHVQSVFNTLVPPEEFGRLAEFAVTVEEYMLYELAHKEMIKNLRMTMEESSVSEERPFSVVVQESLELIRDLEQEQKIIYKATERTFNELLGRDPDVIAV